MSTRFSLELELEGPHYITGEMQRRYNALLRCPFRTRRDQFTVPSNVDAVDRTCACCGETTRLALRRAVPVRRRRTVPTDLFQYTDCRECGHSFQFDYASTAPERIRVECPACNTVKGMRWRGVA